MFRCRGIARRAVIGSAALLAILPGGELSLVKPAAGQQSQPITRSPNRDRPAPPRTAPSRAPVWLDNVIAWTDQLHFHGWRIQRHVDSNECRLLDENDEAQATGTFDACRTTLERIKREKRLAPMSGKAVVLLHGLAAPRWSMKSLASYLRKHGGYQTFVVEYASLRSTIDDAAFGLANIIKDLEGIEEIHLVGHSMGNIVIRRYLAGDDSAKNRWRPDHRIGRVVMISPPNHGSITATQLSDTSVFKTVFGASGVQLGKNWKDLESRLATPTGEFGIIAGGYGNRFGLSLLVPGDDDGRISVEETRLAGASDFLVVGAVHEFIVFDRRVFDYSLRFLKSGYFVSAKDRQPIPKHAAAADRLETRKR
jgi:pimeloyl-ACP methyl ester carboxylesterase